MFKTTFYGSNKIWGGTKKFGGYCPWFRPVAMGLLSYKTISGVRKLRFQLWTVIFALGEPTDRCKSYCNAVHDHWLVRHHLDFLGLAIEQKMHASITSALFTMLFNYFAFVECEPRSRKFNCALNFWLLPACKNWSFRCVARNMKTTENCSTNRTPQRVQARKSIVHIKNKRIIQKLTLGHFMKTTSFAVKR